MKKRIISAAVLALSAVVLLCGAVLSRQQQALADKLIRLHVVADSDSAADQAVKLQVRDAVLAETQALLADTDAPEATLSAHLDDIAAAANRRLSELGQQARASVTLDRELFPTRDYATFSLPAGTYTALRVTIGEGEGRNWWCVVYPSICMTASMDELELAAETAGLTEGEIRLITEETPGYTLKFRSIELLQYLKNLFS